MALRELLGLVAATVRDQSKTPGNVPTQFLRPQKHTAPVHSRLAPTASQWPLAALIQSTACTRATQTALPALSGLNTEASPSFTSTQSLPKASMIFGLSVTIRVFSPASGI